MGLADFERIALERNPTLRQAAAQVDATMSRSHQAGLYPNPTVGYVQEQIGTLGEVTPTASGIATIRQRNARRTRRWLRPARDRHRRQAPAQPRQVRRGKHRRPLASRVQRCRVLNGVRVRFYEVLAAQRLIQIQRELARLNDDAVRTTEQLVNVGQANEPDLLQAKVEARRARVALRNAENHYRGNWEHLVSVVGGSGVAPSST